MTADRQTPESRDPTGMLTSVHAGLCVSSVFHMLVIDSQKSKSKNSFKIVAKIIMGKLYVEQIPKQPPLKHKIL